MYILRGMYPFPRHGHIFPWSTSSLELCNSLESLTGQKSRYHIVNRAGEPQFGWATGTDNIIIPLDNVIVFNVYKKLHYYSTNKEGVKHVLFCIVILRHTI